MKIADIRATTVTVPLVAPLRHSAGAHWGRFVRTIVEVETDDGLIGLGELGGGGESAERAVTGLRDYLTGHDPFDLEAMRLKICNPNREPLQQPHPAPRRAGVSPAWTSAGSGSACQSTTLLGGSLRDEVPFAAYLFFRYPDPETGAGEVRTPDQLVAHARDLKARHGFTVAQAQGRRLPSRLRAGGLPRRRDGREPRRRFLPLRPQRRAECQRGRPVRAGDRRSAERLSSRTPTWGLNGMRRVRDLVRIPLATNTVVVNFEQLAANILAPAVDVILLDTTFWGGIRPCVKAAGVCETFQLPVAVHSSGELGIQLATMLHLGATIPNLSYSADAHYHELTDDIITRRQDGVSRRRDRGSPGTGAGRDAGPGQGSPATPSCTANSARTRTTATPADPAGSPMFPIATGPTRPTTVSSR